MLGTRGFLLVGPSGTGKSTLALTLMTQARLHGVYAALIGDDQVFVSVTGGQVIALGPESIHGLLEIRGAGIANVETIPSAVLHFALRPIRIEKADRLPPEEEVHWLSERMSLPLLRLPYGDGQDSFAILEHFLPQNSAFWG
ncbi:HPr kinase/phosphorylase [Rhizobium sp. 32-5/1]|uniref:HPr kinase/phosphorylase n=1 Tax=Rhizobium sp. 32-5/1 TaxID=3019602 RepID=UPI00240E0093|nr:HPr kinase/phosphorylase [Rhizobium sp. 32-5/1]WEZ85057.1 HPr kinase/phosphorylase [Rhizobium sp. 32-5/1]